MPDAALPAIVADGLAAVFPLSIVVPAGVPTARRAGIGEPRTPKPSHPRWLSDPGSGLTARSGMTTERVFAAATSGRRGTAKREAG